MTKQPRKSTRLLTTGVVVALAVVVAALLYNRYLKAPWTRDGRITAEIVKIAPQVMGTVTEVHVIDNQFVNKGGLLFEIDPEEYELRVESARIRLEEARQQVAALEAAVVAKEAGVGEAEAGITSAQAQVESARASLAAAEGGVDAADAGLRSAQASIDRSASQLEEAVRERDRAEALAKDGAGSVASAESKGAKVQAAQAALDGAHAGMASARASLAQAEAARAEAEAGLAMAEAGRGEAEARLASARAALVQAMANLGAPGDDNAQVRAAQTSLAEAELKLSYTKVLAPTDGYVTNLGVNEGNFAFPGIPMLAFVDSHSFHVQGFFRETQLRHIEKGDRAVITLMGYRGQPIEGEVDSIGWAINPPNIATTEGMSGLVPQVQPSFDWIRLAQRVPVRIKIKSLPPGVRLISGTTASVAIKPEGD